MEQLSAAAVDAQTVVEDWAWQGKGVITISQSGFISDRKRP